MSNQIEEFEAQQEVTKRLIRDYNDNVTEFMERVKAVFLTNDLNLKNLNLLREGLIELKKDDLKNLNRYLDSIYESYSIENEMFRDINKGE